MATHRIPILGFPTLPDATGRVFFEPYNVKATNDIFKNLVLILNDPGASQNHGVYGKFRIPTNYVGTPKVVVAWTSTATTGTCLFAFDYRAIGGNDAESLDQASFQEQIDISDVAPTATDRKLEVSGALTAGNLAADDEVEFYFYRDGTTGAPTDTMAAAAIVFGVYFEYSDQ
jgi:hypothetical protein